MSEYEIYIIARADEAGLFKGPVKVGISSNADVRLRQIQTTCPFKVAVFCRLLAPNREWAERVEHCFHATRKEKRLWGEWFDYDPFEASVILAIGYDILAVCSLSAEAKDELLDQIRERSGVAQIFNQRLRTIQ